MILLLTGLPGSGKSHLARALAPALQATILNRDDIRDAIFPPQDLDYSPQQNQIATRTLLAVAEYVLVRNSDRTFILDGRPMSRAAQIDEVAVIAERTRHDLKILHCVAPPGVIDARLRAHQLETTSSLPVDDRLTKAAAIEHDFEPIVRPHLRVDTTRPMSENLPAIIAWLLDSAA